MKLTSAEFKAIWAQMTEDERDRVRAKAQREQMSLWAVLMDWPSLIPERLRGMLSQNKG